MSKARDGTDIVGLLLGVLLLLQLAHFGLLLFQDARAGVEVEPRSLDVGRLAVQTVLDLLQNVACVRVHALDDGRRGR